MSRITDQLPAAVAATTVLRRRFAATAPVAWDPVTAAAELLRQLGHLAVCLLREDGALPASADDPQRVIADIGDELADIVLSAVSVAVLADTTPEPPACAEPVRNAAVVLLRLQLDCGDLAEAALCHTGARHTPTGTLPGIAAAAGAVLAGCDAFAAHRGLDLGAAFAAMVCDASRFLDLQGVPR
ncbi:hypothetical protein M8542_36540 [Amycolatopsis sp. OK19-0408]|uniref:Uncharacterized protein n=1 Tax=Amycolatopsis iheyensis TaxID=2945988 RepID=A0A9X2NGP8_9PSEU|nr:hypothetical protein [Amycolatopsis iheyensis]MCR6488354.1 hypothetical protein [Amycolatopsis iheyensis]